MSILVVLRVFDFDQTMMDTLCTDRYDFNKLNFSINNVQLANNKSCSYVMFDDGVTIIRKGVMNIIDNAFNKFNADIALFSFGRTLHVIQHAIFLEMYYNYYFNGSLEFPNEFKFDGVIADQISGSNIHSKKSFNYLINYGYLLWQYKQIMVVDDQAVLRWNLYSIPKNAHILRAKRFKIINPRTFKDIEHIRKSDLHLFTVIKWMQYYFAS